MGMVELALIGKLKKTKADKVYVDNLMSSTTRYVSSATVPLNPLTGTIWFDSSTGITYLYQRDSNDVTGWLQLGGGSAVFDDGSNSSSTVPVLLESDVITVTDPSTVTYSFNYQQDFIQVYINRLKLRKSEFTATNGTSITILISLEIDDEIEFITLEGI